MEWIRKYHIAFAWTIATSAMLISLFFSEWMKLPPCDLCWYQRMAMYPLVFILGIGMYRGYGNDSFFLEPLANVKQEGKLYELPPLLLRLTSSFNWNR